LKFTKCVFSRVARWYILRPKIKVWVYFGWPWNGKRWYICGIFGILRGPVQQFCTFYGILVNFSCFGMLYREKSGNPGLKSLFRYFCHVFKSLPTRQAIY
jgi:hypothetical protein